MSKKSKNKELNKLARDVLEIMEDLEREVPDLVDYAPGTYECLQEECKSILGIEID